MLPWRKMEDMKEGKEQKVKSTLKCVSSVILHLIY